MSGHQITTTNAGWYLISVKSAMTLSAAVSDTSELGLQSGTQWYKYIYELGTTNGFVPEGEALTDNSWNQIDTDVSPEPVLKPGRGYWVLFQVIQLEEDTTVPVINVTNPNVTLTEGDAYLVMDGVSATDDRDGIITGNINVSGDYDSFNENSAQQGTYTILYDVNDAAGNPAVQKSKTITVNAPADNTAPVINLNGNATVYVNIDNPTYTEEGASADTGETVLIQGDIVDVNTDGTYTVRYNCTDNNNNIATEVTRTVIVDKTRPVITVVDSSVTLTEGDSYTALTGVTASDTFDGTSTDLTNNITVSGDILDVNTAATYTILYDVNDAAGNSAVQKSKTITVNAPADNTAPVINLNGNATVYVNIDNPTYTEQGASADTGETVQITGDTVDVNTDGTYIVRYNCTDDSGNEAIEVTRTVIVDKIRPVIILNGDATVNVDHNGTYTELSAASNGGETVTIGGDTVDTSVADATYTVTYNSTDAAGNTAIEVTRTVNIESAAAGPSGDIEIKVEYTTGDVWGNTPPAFGGTATTENMAIISARSLDGTNKAITAFDFGMSIAAPSDAWTTFPDFQKETFDGGSFQWVNFSSLPDWSITQNLSGAGLINGYTTDSAQYETLTSDFKTLLRIKYDNTVTLDSVTLTSDTPGLNWTVSIA